MHGFAWRDAGRSLPWRDVHVLVKAFMRRDECETRRALDADWWVSPEVLLLREVELSGRVGAWLQTEDARKRRNQPRRLQLTTAERLAANPERERYDLHTMSEIDELIGWGDRGGGK